jgi:hypothetical protein
VTVEVAEPFATKLVGDAITLDCPAFTPAAVKVTRAVGVIVRLSVVSVAVKVAVPAAVELVVNVAIPLALDVTPPVGAKVPTPVLERETFLPETGLSYKSLKVTVRVEFVLPSAITDEGELVNNECAASTGPGTNVTTTVWVSVMLSSVSVAVKVAVPAAVDWVVKVTTPLALDVVPEEKVPTPVLLRETFFPETGLLLASSRVTVIVEVALPSAIREVGDLVTVETVALTAAALTVIPLWIPVIAVTVSVAVILCVPAVFKVTPLVKVWTPVSAVTKG